MGQKNKKETDMKTKLLVFVLVLALFGFTSYAFCQETQETQEEQVQIQKKQMPMQMMMRGMHSKSMVASSDGGIIVMSGNKLLKYDKDLNLVKEVEIKVDMEGMQKMMQSMQEKCPMMKDASKQGAKMVMTPAAGKEASKEQATK